VLFYAKKWIALLACNGRLVPDRMPAGPAPALAVDFVDVVPGARIARRVSGRLSFP
jgi:hypothetical protein